MVATTCHKYQAWLAQRRFVPLSLREILRLNRGIDRNNARRIAKEQAARAQRQAAGIRNNRVDSQQPMYSSNAPTHSGGSAIAIGPDSRQLATGGWSGWVRLWRLADGKAKRGWHGHRGEVTSLAFLSSGERLVSSGYDGRLVLWDLKGNELRSVATPSPITDMVVDEARNRLVSGHRDGYVRIWRYPDLILLREVRNHRSAVRAVSLAPNTGWMASSGFDGRVLAWAPNEKPVELADPPTDA